MRRARRVGTGRAVGRRGFGAASRRDFLRIGGVSLAGAALLGTAACGGGGGGPQTADDGSIVVVFSMGPDDSGSLTSLIEQFNEDRAGEIQIDYRQQPTDTGAYFDQLRTQFQAGGGDIALIGGDVIWPAQFAANGWISDLSDLFTEDMRSGFIEGPIESNTYDGSVFGVPWFTDAGVLHYRQDLLDDAGISEPPATWTELKEMASQIQEEAGTEWGYVFQGGNYEGGTVNGLEFINSFGGAVLNEDDATQVTIDSPESVAGLEMARSMVDDEVSQQAVSTYTEEESEAAFLNGNAVFCRNWPYMYGLVGDPEASQIETEQVGVSALPAAEDGESVSVLGGWNFYVNAAVPQETQDAAWEFIQFMTDPEQQKFRALEGGFLPTLTDLYDDPEILDEVPVIALGGEALQRTVPRPVSPVYSDMSLQMAEQFNAVLNGNASPEEAITTLQENLQGIADQAPE
ncbi:MAG: ABC transporter substrate-binding protein [Rubrobacteraceae bacterium]